MPQCYEQLGPFSGYPGGNSRVASAIRKYEPENFSRYVEAFAGYASRFFEHPLCGVKEAVLNDADPAVAQVLDMARTGRLLDAIERRGCLKNDRLNLKQLQRSDDPLDRLALNAMAYRLPFIGSPVPRSNLSEKYCFENIYSKRHHFDKLNSLKVTITCNDYKDTIHKYDSRSTFFYLDPPWTVHSKSMYHPDYTSIDWQEMGNVLSDIQGKFMIYSQWNEPTALMYQDMGFRVVHFDKRKGEATYRANRPNGYMLIMNY